MSKPEDRPVRLVCFDLGGVLIRICRSWAEGCEAAGLHSDSRDHASVRLDGELRSIHHEHQVGRVDGPTFAQRVSEYLGHYSPDEIMAIHEAWMRGEYAGTASVIDRLHDAGFTTAALSNTNHEHWLKIVEFPSVQRLQHLLASHLLGLSKPDPAIYHALEDRLSVRGREVLFFDDLTDNIEAAVSVGWRAEQIDPLRETAPQIEAALVKHEVLP